MQSGQPAKRIGELLVERGLVSQRQLEDALARQRATGEFLGAILLKQQVIQPKALLEAIAEQFGISYESIDPVRMDWSATKLFPPSQLSDGNWFPIRADAVSVTVAIANPLDAAALSAAQRAAGAHMVKPVLVLEHELRAVIKAYREQALRALAARLNHHTDDQTTE